MIILELMGGESATVKGLRPLRGAKAPLTLQDPGVQLSIVHPDSEPPLLLCEKVEGSSSVMFHRKRTAGPPFFCGADDEIHVFEPLTITGVQVVAKITTHSFH